MRKNIKNRIRLHNYFFLFILCHFPFFAIANASDTVAIVSKYFPIDSNSKIIVIPNFPKSENEKFKKQKYQQKQRNVRLVETDVDSIRLLLSSYLDSLKPIISNPTKYKLQIIYTRINRDINNNPNFKIFEFKVDDRNYFYPASLVKLPLCALALQKINETNFKGFNMQTPMFTSALQHSCQTMKYADSTSENYNPSIEHYIKKMLLVSDNDAYSRVYEYLGMDYISKKLSAIGLRKIIITHRFDPNCSTLQNRCTNPIYFKLNPDTFLFQNATCGSLKNKSHYSKSKVGRAYINNKGKKILKPKDFSTMNYFRLADVDGVLKRIIFPNYFHENERFTLTNSNYNFLRKYLSMIPRESNFPKYPDSLYEDSYKKYLLYGTEHGKMENDSVRIFNIVGQSYGFLSDCAYVVNPRKGIEFFLSVVIYVNEDGVINDGAYEYKTIGFPFLTRLGKVFYNIEYNRRKNVLPILDEFIFDYNAN